MTTATRAMILFALLLGRQPAAAVAQYEEFAVPGGTLLIDWRGEFDPGQRDVLRAWLGSVGETVSLLYGSLPRSPIRIELTARRSTGDERGAAVPFGRVKRHEPQGVEFFVDPDRPLRDFIQDWTAYHELSHLFIPYPGRVDVWFSEGLASYYQNVLQYRAGLLTDTQTWQKFYEGFERGRRDNRGNGMTLAELSPRMRARRAYMRVYWSGVLYFLEADIALRAHSDGQVVLDTILERFGACCLRQQRRWNGRSIAAEFDRLAGAEIFLPLYERYRSTEQMPDYLPALGAAGIAVHEGRVIVDRPGFLRDAG